MKKWYSSPFRSDISRLRNWTVGLAFAAFFMAYCSLAQFLHQTALKKMRLTTSCSPVLDSFLFSSSLVFTSSMLSGGGMYQLQKFRCNQLDGLKVFRQSHLSQFDYSFSHQHIPQDTWHIGSFAHCTALHIEDYGLYYANPIDLLLTIWLPQN